MNNKEYILWKDWNQDFSGKLKPGNTSYYNQIFKECLRGKKNILEIGFGNGGLLSYFRAAGHEVVGVEVNDELVNKANELGYKAYLGNVSSISNLQNEKFDIVVGFSVAEHMSYDQLKSLFLWISDHLKDRGKFYLQFPEGASPFGLANQNGDFTHVTSLTKPKIHVLCQFSNMKLLSYKDDVLQSNRLCSLGLPGKMFLLILQQYAHLIKFVIRVLFYPLATTLRLGTNSIVIMEKS